MRISVELGVLIHCLRCSGLDITVPREYDQGQMIREIHLGTDGGGRDDVLCLCRTGELSKCSGPRLAILDERMAEPAAGAGPCFFLHSSLSIDALYQRVVEYAAEYLNWNVEVLSFIQDVKALPQIVARTEFYFPFPLVIFNEIGEVIATTKSVATDYPPFLRLIRERHMPHDIFTQLTSPLANLRAVYSGQEHGPYVGRAMVGDNTYNVYRSCFLDNQIIYRCCFFCQDVPPSQEFLAFSEKFFGYVDRFVGSHRKVFEGDMGGEAYLLKALVSGAYSDRDFLIQNLQNCQVPLEGNFMLANVAIKKANYAKLDMVRQQLYGIGNLKCFIYEGGVVALLNLRVKNRDLNESINYYTESIQAILELNDGIAGISNAFQDIFSLFDAYLQTEKVLELSRVVHPVSPVTPFFCGKTRILHYKEVFVYHLLNDVGSWAVKENCVAQDLLHYAQEARLSQEEILKTLYVHISNGCRHSVTAQLLSLHRNTVANRLEQIEQCLHINLSSFEDCINVILAIKAIECGNFN